MPFKEVARMISWVTPEEGSMPTKKSKVAGSVSQQLRSAETKREASILERIRQNVLNAVSGGCEGSPRVAIRSRTSGRLSSRS